MKKKKKTAVIPMLVSIIICIIIAIVVAIVSLVGQDEITMAMTPELARYQEYDTVEAGDEYVFDDNGDQITEVNFDAFFLKDLDGDNIADSVRGTCNEVGSSATLYMDLSIIDDGYIKDATITINSNNFYFYTSIVADSVISQNYISTNTKTISLNDVSNGTEKLIIGYVRSGDYSSTSTKTAAIGNDTTKYSMENSITFSGTFVSSADEETEFTKTVYFDVDWYGEVDAGISLSSSSTTKSLTKTVTDLDSLLGDDGLTLSFTVYTTESLNELIMAGSYISGTIPDLNGYMPTSVKISGTNVTYTYDEETGEYTAQREAVLNSSRSRDYKCIY